MLVVNHALLMSDIAMGGGLLPEYNHLIIDEAHNLEEEATDALGFTVDRPTVMKLLAELSAHTQLAGDSRRLPRKLHAALARDDDESSSSAGATGKRARRAT